ncbi:MAG: thioredoxin-disulfide reductase [Puniceicoccales bacterium]|jgi:thioredoxin reductase (NADPH)|nr:thioredoxin-disulfide reductase [Puniceicoccales bacterium]
MGFENLVIIGSGCAGLTAAIYAARADLSPLVIEGDQPGGQLIRTTNIENFPGFPEGINGFDLVSNMRIQAEKMGARFRSGVVERIDLAKKIVICEGDRIESKAIIIATGASPRMLNIPGEEEFFGGKGVSTCATCDGTFYKNKTVAVIGGGDSACEEVIFLTRFCAKVYLIHRRDQLRASKIIADRVLSNPKVEMLWNTIPLKICGEKKVTHLRIKTDNEERDLSCDGVFLAIGHVPNTKIFVNQIECDSEGYILTDCVNTQIPGVFVAGDCCDRHYRQAITAAGMGAAAAIRAERYLS